MPEENSHDRSSPAIDRATEDPKHKRRIGDESNGGGCCDFPLDERHIGRHQKVRLWLSAMRYASWSGNGRRQMSAVTTWGAFEDSGTFSADTCQCDDESVFFCVPARSSRCCDSQLRPYQGSTDKSSIRRNESNQIPSSRESLTTGLSSRSSRTSLSKLLQNKLKLLSCPTPPAVPEGQGLASTREVNSVTSQPTQAKRNTSQRELSTSQWELSTSQRVSTPWITVSSDGLVESSLTLFSGSSVKPNTMFNPSGAPMKTLLERARQSTLQRSTQSVVLSSPSGKSSGRHSETIPMSTASAHAGGGKGGGEGGKGGGEGGKGCGGCGKVGGVDGGIGGSGGGGGGGGGGASVGSGVDIGTAVDGGGGSVAGGVGHDGGGGGIRGTSDGSGCAGDSNGGGSGGGGGGEVSSTASSFYEAPKRPAIFHVRVLPAMCYLVWRPDMLRRECLMDRGQAAYLNALHPSTLSMEKLMTAVAARLDIEVPLLSKSRPDYDPKRATSFEYVFRWHTPNGPRIELGEHISEVDHPEDQNGTPEYPVRIFIAGSPGWLARAK